MSQSQGPTFINLPPSGADTPSEAPGTPTSTTTSLSTLSTLSTTAIKDGHRGHHIHTLGRSHAHNPSTTSLEAERADRISRLAGLERIAALRAIPPQQQANQSHSRQHSVTASTSSANNPPSSSASPQTAGNYPLNYPDNTTLTPAYFDSQGQPVAAPTKMSTVGTASATESNGRDDDDARTTRDDDDDMLSVATDTASLAPMMTGDEEMDGVGPRSVSGFEDRMSDDGSASLVGFGEGAGSTLSGPIYQRRPLSQLMPQFSANSNAPPSGNWLLERQGSGLSDVPPGLRRDRDSYSSVGQPSDTPAGSLAMQERRDARMLDGVAPDPVGAPGDDIFIDTTTRSPVPNTLLQQYQQQQFRERQHQAIQALWRLQGQPQGQYQGQPQGQYQGQPQGQYQGQYQGQSQVPQQGQPQGQYQGQYQGQSQVPQQGQPQGSQQSQPQIQPQAQPQIQPQAQPQAQLQAQPQQSNVPPTSAFLGNTVRQSHHQPRTPLQQMQVQTAAGDAERMVQSLDGGETQLPPGSATLGSPDSAGDRLGRFYFEDTSRK